MNNLVRESARRIIEVNPDLSYAEIGRLLGVSRERIRQVVGVRRRHARIGQACGKRLKLSRSSFAKNAYYRGYCPECWALEKERRSLEHYRLFTCEYCGNRFARKASAVKRQLKRGQRIRWCSKRCQGHWLASRYSKN
ncbi:MAG: hypothetical protein JSW38_01480 [Dehalococcoidia bacterium]|nr:MAG: hypothetical protein JSW38_01480 [Dehalococcoidia bacterium]